MENISLVLDRILLFASHKAYSLAAGLELLQVLPRADALDTHRHVVRRLASVFDVAHAGHLDVLELLDRPLLEYDVKHIIKGAALGGNVSILDWLLNVSPAPERFLSRTPQSLVHLAIVNDQPDVLDWCLAHGANIDSHLDNLFLQARDFCMLKSLEWLKQYAVEHGRDYAFPPFNAFDGTIFVSADRRVAMLAWWKADHESRSMPPLFGANDDFPTELASWAADGLLVVDWWRRYCVEMDRDFTWTALDETGLQNVVKYGSISLCQWWWDETVQEIGILHSNMFLADILNTICDSPQTEYLDWYWNLCTNTDGEIEIARDWRPRYPFVRLNVIQWWEAKVEAGFMDPSVFDIDQQRRNMFGFVGTLTTKLDALINQPRRHNLEIAALDWYWARRDRNGLEPNLSENAVLSMMQRRDPELLQWYLARCTPESPLPALTLDVVAAMVSRGQVDMLEQIFLVLETLNKPFDVTTTTEIEAPVLNRRIASSTVLDYLWEYCTRVNKRFEPCYNTKSAVLAIKAYDLDAAKWWYNMHRVHGMAFPSTKDLAGLKCDPDSEMGRWIQSIQLKLQ